MKDKLEKLSAAFVLADANDPAVPRDLRSRFEQLLESAPHDRIVDTILAAATVLERLSDGKASDPAAAMAAVGQAISAIQAMAAAGKDAASVPIPPALTAASQGTPAAPVAPPPAAAPAASFTWPKEIDAELMGGFIGEAREHLEASDAHLLTLEANPGQAEAINSVFRAFHTIKGSAGYLELQAIQALAHETENLLDLARKGELTLGGPAMDATFEAVDAMKRLLVGAEALLRTGMAPETDPGLDALIRKVRETAANRGKALPAIIVDAPPAAKAVEAPAAAPAAEKAPASEGTGAGVREVVKVDAERLDRLVDLIGELVIAESMVSQSRQKQVLSNGEGMSKAIGQLDKITRELQEMGMSLRMMPVKPLFQRMARLARDLSKKLGKPLDFGTAGDDIEVDKAVVDRVADPLIHIIRNSMDHGIEEGPAQRRAAGKPEAGRIELRAYHREGNIVLEIADDGRGLDKEAILAKGIERGLVRKGDAPTEQEIFNLIFLPGFSTAKVVTEVSGRGVGMDVVRKNIQALRGHIEIESKPGKGTVIRLRLPLTLAIIEGMVIRVGAERYIVPTLSVVRLVRPEASQIATALGRGEMLSLQNQLIPLFRMGRVLQVADAVDDPVKGVAVVVEDGGKRAALVADELLGQQQIVIKSLGDAMERVPGVSGGAILPDGQVGLILDVGGLLKVAHGAPGAEPPTEALAA